MKMKAPRSTPTTVSGPGGSFLSISRASAPTRVAMAAAEMSSLGSILRTLPDPGGAVQPLVERPASVIK